jgi:hypothetical protein
LSKQIVADSDHCVPVAPAGGQVVVQQRVLATPGLLQQARLDAPAQRCRGGDHHAVGVAAPAGEVDDAEHLLRGRVADRHGHARELFQVLHVVLVAEHPGRTAALQRSADAVRADVPLGVAEPGGEPDAVEVVSEDGVAGVAGEDDAVGVAEDEAGRFGRELLGRLTQHGAGRTRHGGVAVDVGLEGDLEVVGGDIPQPRARPRGEDRLPDDVRAHRPLGEERRAGDRQLRGARIGRLIRRGAAASRGARGGCVVAGSVTVRDRRARRLRGDALAVLSCGHTSLPRTVTVLCHVAPPRAGVAQVVPTGTASPYSRILR